MASERPGGAPNTLTSLSPTPPPFTQQGDGLIVRVVSGPDTDAEVTVGDRAVVIGSAPDCDCVLTDPAVSRRHLSATRSAAGLILEDLGSKNGSFFSGQKFERTELTAGAEFRVGKTVFKVLPDERVLDPDPAEAAHFGGLVGGAPSMRKLFAMIDRVAKTDAAVLLEGETGVGKEVVAEELHRRSRRADRPLVIFDCGAVPEELIESTLFGHVKGAFTGASTDKEGVLAQADGGTVFLDEIGELKLELQPALLRVLDRGMIRKVGGTSYQQIDVRVIAATHRNLGDRIEHGQFREDLYYRLAVVRLSVPPLREREGDVQLLVRHFLDRLGRPDVEVTRDAVALLEAHSWPGNVRELKNVVERGLALSEDGRFSADAISAGGGLASGRAATPPVEPAAQPPAAPGAERTARRLFRDAKAEAVERFEREYLSDLMSDYDSITAAAQAAGMDRKHLRTLLGRYGLRGD